jgi:hypothetical protein
MATSYRKNIFAGRYAQQSEVHMASSASPAGAGARRGIPNLPAMLRLAPRNTFEGVIAEGYSTDVFGWFGESWAFFKANIRSVIIASIPAVVTSLILFYLYYRDAGRASVASDALFGSYLRTIALMALAYLPSFVTMSAMARAKSPIRDSISSIIKLPWLMIAAAFTWAPIIFSGLMHEMRAGIVWWAIPIAIYLAVAYSFAPFLMVDGKLDPWSALETSRRAVSRNWFGIASLYAMYYPAAWVFSAAISMIPGVMGTVFVVDEMAKKRWDDPMNILFGLSNIFMAGLFYLFLIFFQIALATAYIRIFRPVGYRREIGK